MNVLDLLMAFATLFALELVLGVDNVIFISILASKLPTQEQQKARLLGLSVAVISRILLLFGLSWVVSLTTPLFELNWFDKMFSFSGRDLILLIGGLFLLTKATSEIHHKLEERNQIDENAKNSSGITLKSVVIQIFFLDVVFSLDSVITAVGMVEHLPVMIAAVLASTVVMLFFAKKISDFVEHHPTLKMLALSFLLMIGLTLVAEALHFHIPKGYIYFSMAFSLMVEVLNIKLRSHPKA